MTQVQTEPLCNGLPIYNERKSNSTTKRKEGDAMTRTPNRPRSFPLCLRTDFGSAVRVFAFFLLEEGCTFRPV